MNAVFCIEVLTPPALAGFNRQKDGSGAVSEKPTTGTAAIFSPRLRVSVSPWWVFQVATRRKDPANA
jgi:hypothetical protein